VNDRAALRLLFLFTIYDSRFMMKTFLETLTERIVVFDGAMGTNLHAQDLTVEDYGGPQFEGCPETPAHQLSRSRRERARRFLRSWLRRR
jgi:hypothetical protein